MSKITVKEAAKWVLMAAEFQEWEAAVKSQIEDDFTNGLYTDKTCLHLVYGKQAYCKYCYSRHAHWFLSPIHWRPAWTCVKCNHTTADEHMRYNSE